jgi:hypothetical protein
MSELCATASKHSASKKIRISGFAFWRRNFLFPQAIVTRSSSACVRATLEFPESASTLEALQRIRMFPIVIPLHGSRRRRSRRSDVSARSAAELGRFAQAPVRPGLLNIDDGSRTASSHTASAESADVVGFNLRAPRPFERPKSSPNFCKIPHFSRFPASN